MAGPFRWQIAGAEDGGNRRIARRLQRCDRLSRPQIRRKKNLGVAVEVCHINPERNRWPHDQIERACPVAGGFTALAVLQAIGGDRLLFLPQQDQGDTLALALLIEERPVRGGAPRSGCVGGRRKQLSL